MAGVEQRADHVVFGVVETSVIEIHAMREVAEDFNVRSRFAGRGHHGSRKLQMIMTVREIKIGVLEERRRRQQDVGVIGGVSLELLEHHGEQIVATETF